MIQKNLRGRRLRRQPDAPLASATGGLGGGRYEESFSHWLNT
ncbi:MAG: hypothetical protein AAGB12_08130 [Pseudomonadota bacterium]